MKSEIARNEMALFLYRPSARRKRCVRQSSINDIVGPGSGEIGALSGIAIKAPAGVEAAAAQAAAEQAKKKGIRFLVLQKKIRKSAETRGTTSTDERRPSWEMPVMARQKQLSRPFLGRAPVSTCQDNN